MQKRIDVTLESIKGATSTQTENLVITITEQDVDPSMNYTGAEKTRKHFPSRKAVNVETFNEGGKDRTVVSVHGNTILELYQDTLKLDGSQWGTEVVDIAERIRAELEA